MQWQPIETAPKDGSEVDLWTANGRVPDAKWNAKRSRWEEWGLGGFEQMTWVDVDYPPTHWMPLPNPPEQDQRGDDTTTCRWWRDEFGNWCCACSDTMPDFTPWPSADPNGAHCPKCGKTVTTQVHDKP